MTIDWPMSKDEIYGPPPAYSLYPPPSIYTIPETQIEHQERSSFSSSPPIVLTLNFTRYLLATALLHFLIGLATIICDIQLISMNESLPFVGICTGSICIIFGIYLIIFMSHTKKSKWSLQRFKLFHIIICLLVIIALILSSINLGANACYENYFQFDQCQPTAKKLKIVLITFYAVTFAQICFTSILTFVHIR
ncbi:unnamed protein product [Adineta ricciae]|uniref:Uncharacterized protein n=1 Tax=Adineta ricciae TaxID=249248 RepID=A0A814J1B8_ADIRI|nr:unnamed protein product [Adineta ricciae]CAF1030884.1 unnamed protein product [Adineta ricciae]